MDMAFVPNDVAIRSEMGVPAEVAKLNKNPYSPKYEKSWIIFGCKKVHIVWDAWNSKSPHVTPWVNDMVHIINECKANHMVASFQTTSKAPSPDNKFIAICTKTHYDSLGQLNNIFSEAKELGNKKGVEEDASKKRKRS
jgi:hypothetical protein